MIKCHAERRRKHLMSAIEEIFTIPSGCEASVFGSFDENLKKIEKAFHVSVVVRDEGLRIVGEEKNAERAKRVFENLFELAGRGSAVTRQTVDYAISLCRQEEDKSLVQLDDDIICRTSMGKPIKPKTFGQEDYVKAIREKTIVFGIGPAGTGKTYLAMAMAINAFKNGDVARIILTRPAIEAGENLGFLPGDLQSKVDPYLRPLYDAIYQIMGADSYLKNAEKGLIEVAPLAYMRGRTLDNAFIILDEAQNTTPAQMKMFLTRVGFNSKVIVTGDLTQKDLPAGEKSGLETAAEVLGRIDDIRFIHFTDRDVVRHPLVMQIVRAYEEYENKNAKKSGGQRSKK